MSVAPRQGQNDTDKFPQESIKQTQANTWAKNVQCPFFFLPSIPSTVSSVRLVIIKKDTVGKAVHLYLPATPYGLFPYWVLKAG